MQSIVIYISDISNYQTLIKDLKPMLKSGYDCFIEKRPSISMSEKVVCNYYLHIYKK